MEETAQTTRRRDLVVIAILIGVVAIFFIDVLLGTHGLFLRDVSRYYYPTKKLIRDTILAGEFPYWNRAYGAGQPMAANPEYAVFYPLQLLVLLPDYIYAFQLHILIHLAIGIAGVYVLLRSLRLRPVSAVFGAVCWTFGGLTFSLLNLLPYLFILAWTPWAFFFVRRLLQNPNLRDFAAAALCFGLQVLTAEPTTLVQVWLLVGAYTLHRSFSGVPPADRGRQLVRNGGLIGGLLLATFALGLVQLLPAVDHAGDSVRARPFDYRLASSWSMPLVRPVEMFFPGAFGHVYSAGPGRYWGAALYKPKPIPFLFSIYSGLLCAVLLVAGLMRRVRGTALIAGVSLFAFILAAGKNTPLFRILYDSGIAAAARYPEKFALMAMIAIVLFSARVFDRFWDDEALRKNVFVITAGLAVIAGIVFLSAFTPIYDAAFQSFFSLPREPRSDWLTAMSKIDWLLALLRASALLAILTFARKAADERLVVRAGMLLVLFTLADLHFAQKAHASRMPREFFEEPEVAATLDRDRSSYRIFHEADWYDYYGFSNFGKLYASTGEGTYWTGRNGMMPMMPAAWGFSLGLERDYDKTALLPTVDLTDALWAVKDRVPDGRLDLFMAMSNARYRSEFVDFRSEVARIAGNPARVRPIRFVERPTNHRYYFADQIVPIRGKDDFVRHLVSSDRWSQRVAFIEGFAFEPAAGKVVAASETPNSARVDVEAAGPALLVASVTSHKYWRATIDGKPAPISRVNVAHQGIVVPAGRHRIEFRYVNGTLRAGGVVSVIAALAALGLMIWKKTS